MTLGRVLIRLLVAIASAICADMNAMAASPCTLDKAIDTTIDPEPLLTNALGVNWSAPNNLISFMEPVAGGYYRIFTARPDGSDRKLLTPGTSGLPNKHQGTPYWHPSGRYLMMTAQKQDWSGRSLFGISDYEALPGFGRHDDLWIITADAQQAWRLTDDPNTRDEGILIPVFSANGRNVAWSARQPGGTYMLKVADFIEKGKPHLENIRSYLPGGPGYYETGSFSSDGSNLIYTSSQDSGSFWRSQIYRLDLGTGRSVRLTQGNDYNEHPVVAGTPQGDRIVYMSTHGVDRYPWHFFLGTDWYAMHLDGSNVKRLTRMNVRGADNPENAGYMQVAGRVAVSPSGEFMLGDVQDSLVKQTGFVRVIHFSCR
jgi:Tol biopolymer transport system component